MNGLAELLAPHDNHHFTSASGDAWSLEIGPVDLSGEMITIQRGMALPAMNDEQQWIKQSIHGPQMTGINMAA